MCSTKIGNYIWNYRVIYNMTTFGIIIIISITKQYKQNIPAIIFPWYPLTLWCAKNLGMKIFLKNLDFFIQLNLEGGFSLIVDLIRLLLHKISKK